ncbi:hypothetical protein EZMO1_3486 [Endozoicomonas montiporae CL-33]|uniref:Uncharacterized protein n=1 Tax=Endozoicomonas montiporae CL-33 TaxID=570277 RepID=A0A142BFE6_9GAMM|nr:hypothetical protein EZMO1_3486 [Endozoicomonas montiporae CL-33]
MKLQFLGATGTVTGSKYLVECHGRKILVVWWTPLSRQ